MTPDDRDDPFDDIFREIERMMEDMVGAHGGPEGGPQPGQQATSQTHVDVYEEDDVLRVVADLPGVEQSDIAVQCDGEYLTLSAASETRSYEERVTLPDRVDPESGSGTYNNGVLEITFDRTGSSTEIDIE